MSEQTVFVSSVMAGMAAERRAVCNIVEDLGGRVSMFEHLGGRDDDVETAYLAGVQASDIYVGILGERYGTPAPSGYSPTHAEYNEAVRSGLRISVWSTTAGMDGRQRDFLNEVRVFHTTGNYSSPDELSAGLKRRLTQLAAADSSPWCKVGQVLFRADRYSDDGNGIVVEATLRDDDVIAALESMRPDDWHRAQPSRITCTGRTDEVDIQTVTVQTGAGRARHVRIEATKSRSMHGDALLLDASFNGRSPADLTELAIRVALFGETNPLGPMAFMAEIDNPLLGIDQLGLDDDSFAGVAETLLVEALVGSGRVGRISALQIGPARSGRPIRFEWLTPRRYSNVEPERRQIEGNLGR
ncbi:DUF4062 domain-containing protein [Candidatus Poriferisodalis sp.]|uniref:DUF4062 domain-containing protein n=1 Tax=Candidatus Poriferisodalis sp. TaxID=3101277 RepID=UPI003B025F28